MRTIGVVTVSRSDYGHYLPVLRKIQADPDLNLHLIAGGMHLSPEYGMTAEEIEKDGFKIDERIEFLLSSDTPQGIAKSMGLGTIGFAQAYSRNCPDILLVLGDRFEMHAAAVAALPFKIPIAHIHGGEITEGAFDDALRHSMTKLSHFHFVATEEYRGRVIQMGEEPWRVILSGAPGLDNIHTVDIYQPHELEAEFGLCVKSPPLLVTFHPVTLEYEDTEWHLRELFSALSDCEMPIIVTQPNADTEGRTAALMMREFALGHSQVQFVENLGTRGYFSLMSYAAAMVGNSSSGLIEAPSFGLPVVNIGNRQSGRIKARNVIDVDYGRNAILSGIESAINPKFRENLQTLTNPYGDGHSAERIVLELKKVKLGEVLLKKRFNEPRCKEDMGHQVDRTE
jgi:UDP-N-acetylglucosamine 2-epimerase (non-hydrolysing)/GDP/UDP-N,N'-diacetylbacillosamine 2-epimerase (hydrolysing)